MFTLWPFNKAVCWILLLGLPAPVLIFSALLSGAVLLDGMAGAPTANTDFQQSLIVTGAYLAIGVPISIIISLYAVAKYAKEDDRYYFILAPLILLVLVAIVIAL